MHLFEDFTFGKASTEIIFARPDGRKWGPSQQARRLATACETANLSKTSFHDLRRTYGARLALKGVPMAVIAEALGHADERITKRHYAHLRSEEHTSELQSLMRISYAVFCLKKKNNQNKISTTTT